MNLLLFFSLTIITTSLSDQSFYVLHAPSYVHFISTQTKLPVSEIADMISVIYGLPLHQELSFKGLGVGEIFRKPKANFLVTLTGFGDDSHHLNLNSNLEYPVLNDQIFPETSSVISQLRRFMPNPLIVDFTEERSIFDMKSHHSKLFESLSPTTDKVRALIDSGKTFLKDYDISKFNTSDSTDLLFLSEFQLIDELLHALQRKNAQVTDNVPDLYHFKIDGFKLLTDIYGYDNPKINAAYKILEKFLNQISTTIQEIYNGNAVIQVLTISGEDNDLSGRIRRSLLETTVDASVTINNIAEDVSPDFCANFNIVLLTSVFLGTVVIILAYSMWNIDPGRNSILYRMTSQRIKKD